MILLVCGGREYSDRTAVRRTLNCIHRKFDIELLIHGMCTGADTLADEWAVANLVPTLRVPICHGEDGFARNERMFDLGVKRGLKMVLAFPGGNGTRHMVKTAHAGGVLAAPHRDVLEYEQRSFTL